jgi:chromosome segregation ATPase
MDPDVLRLMERDMQISREEIKTLKELVSQLTEDAEHNQSSRDATLNTSSIHHKRESSLRAPLEDEIRLLRSQNTKLEQELDRVKDEASQMENHLQSQFRDNLAELEESWNRRLQDARDRESQRWQELQQGTVLLEQAEQQRAEMINYYELLLKEERKKVLTLEDAEADHVRQLAVLESEVNEGMDSNERHTAAAIAELKRQLHLGEQKLRDSLEKSQRLEKEKAAWKEVQQSLEATLRSHQSKLLVIEPQWKDQSKEIESLRSSCDELQEKLSAAEDLCRRRDQEYASMKAALSESQRKRENESKEFFHGIEKVREEKKVWRREQRQREDKIESLMAVMGDIRSTLAAHVTDGSITGDAEDTEDISGQIKRFLTHWQQRLTSTEGALKQERRKCMQLDTKLAEAHAELKEAQLHGVMERERHYSEEQSRREENSRLREMITPNKTAQPRPGGLNNSTFSEVSLSEQQLESVALTSMRSELRNRDSEMNRLVGEVTTVRASAQLLEKEIEGLREERQDLLESLREREVVIEERDLAIDRISREMSEESDSLRHSIGMLRKELSRREEEEQRVQGQLTEGNNAKKQLDDEITSLQLRCRKAEQLHGNAEARLQELEPKLEASHRAIQSLERRNHELKSAVSAGEVLRVQLEAAEAERDELFKKIAYLQQVVEERNDDIGKLQKQHRSTLDEKNGKEASLITAEAETKNLRIEVQLLKAQLQDQEKREEDLALSLAEEQKERLEMSAVLEHDEVRMEKLTEDYKKRKHQVKEMRTACQTAAMALKKNEENMVTLQVELEASKSQLQEAQAAWNAERERLHGSQKEQVQQHGYELERLTREHEGVLHQQQQEFAAQGQEFTHQLAREQEERKQLSLSLQKRERVISALKEQSSLLEAELGLSQQEAQRSNQQLADLQRALENLRSESESYRQKYETKCEIEESTSHQLQEMQAELLTVKGSVRSQQVAMETLDEEIAKKTSQISKLEESLRASEAAKFKEASKLEGVMQMEREDWRHQQVTWEGERQRMEEAQKSLRDEIGKLKGDLDANRKTIRDMQASYDSLQLETSGLQRRQTLLQKEVKQKEEEIALQKKRTGEKESALDKLRVESASQVKDMQGRLEQLHSNVDALRSGRDDDQREIARFADLVRIKEQDIAELRGTISRLQGSLTDMKSRANSSMFSDVNQSLPSTSQMEMDTVDAASIVSKQAQREISDLKQRLRHATDQMHRNSVAMHELEQIRQRLEEEAEETHHIILDLERKNKALTRRVDDLSRKEEKEHAPEPSHRVTELEHTIQSLTRRNEEAHSTQIELHAQIRVMQERNAELEEELADQKKRLELVDLNLTQQISRTSTVDSNGSNTAESDQRLLHLKSDVESQFLRFRQIIRELEIGTRDRDEELVLMRETMSHLQGELGVLRRQTFLLSPSKK